MLAFVLNIKDSDVITSHNHDYVYNLKPWSLILAYGNNYVAEQLQRLDNSLDNIVMGTYNINFFRCCSWYMQLVKRLVCNVQTLDLLHRRIKVMASVFDVKYSP